MTDLALSPVLLTVGPTPPIPASVEAVSQVPKVNTAMCPVHLTVCSVTDLQVCVSGVEMAIVVCTVLTSVQ